MRTRTLLSVAALSLTALGGAGVAALAADAPPVPADHTAQLRQQQPSGPLADGLSAMPDTPAQTAQ